MSGPPDAVRVAGSITSAGSREEGSGWATWNACSVDFASTLGALHGLLGRRVFVEVRAAGELEVVTMRGTLAAGDDLGEFEKAQGIGGPSHDRLLFNMREHPFPEGFYLDRRTFVSAEWRDDKGDRELRVTLVGGLLVVLIEDTAID